MQIMRGAQKKKLNEDQNRQVKQERSCAPNVLNISQKFTAGN